MRAHRRFKKDARLKRHVHVSIICTVVLVVAIDVLGFLLVSLEIQPLTAHILIALGNFIAHGFWSCLAIVLLIQGSEKPTLSQKLCELVAARIAWGALSCSGITLAMAIISMVFLKLPATDYFLLVSAPII